MPSERSKEDREPIVAFGRPREILVSDPVHEPEAALVVPMGVSYCGLMFSTNQNFVFQLQRDQMARLHAAIGRALQETAPGAH